MFVKRIKIFERNFCKAKNKNKKMSHEAEANIGQMMCEERNGDKGKRCGLVRRFRKKKLEVEQSRKLEGRWFGSSDSPAGVAVNGSDPS